MFMWRRGSAQEVGVEPRVPPAIRVCIAYIYEVHIDIAYTGNTNNSSITE